MEIVQKNNPILRQVAKDIPLKDIGEKRLKDLIAQMFVILDKCEDGVALAAPQVGESIRLFIVSPKALLIQNSIKKNVSSPEKESIKLVYVNPIIVKKSSKKVILDEGCLSVKKEFGKIGRHEKVTIEAYDEAGKKFTRGASGLLAEIFQHEVDHLDGILFIDYAKNITRI